MKVKYFITFFCQYHRATRGMTQKEP